MAARRLFDFSNVPSRQRALILACMLFWSILCYLFVSRFVLGAAEVVGTSMVPTLDPGERTLINRFVYRTRSPQPGEIIAFRLPDDGSFVTVKRVIALPGDVVEIRGGGVYVNGRRLGEPYLARSTPTSANALAGHAYLVAPQCYFVLGDNREASADSRSFGAVPFQWIVGRVF